MESKLFSTASIRIALAARFYYTSRTKKPTLYTKISPLGDPRVSLVPVLDDWIFDGNKVRVAELQRIVQDLRKRKRFSQALEVSEWMNKNGICIFSKSEHAVHLDLIGRVRGFLSAESYFNNLNEQDKVDKTYGALLNCYVRQRQIDKSLSHYQKMKEMGFASTALTYNDIMCLYTKTGQHEKVPNLLTEMKENKVLPDNYSYRICINSLGERSNIEEMEKILQEMEHQPHIVMDWNTYAVAANFFIKEGIKSKAFYALKKAEERLDTKDGLGYNHLISLYASLGEKDEVMRLWILEKTACGRQINRDFITMLESLVRLGDLEEAEKVLEQWESSGNCYDFHVPNTVIIGYSKTGLCEKAEAMLQALMEKGRITTPNSWSLVASGYLRKNEPQKAVKCVKKALSLYEKGKGWKPNPMFISDMLRFLGDDGDIKTVKSFVDVLRKVIPVNREMYHTLIKAHIRFGKEVDELLDHMKTDGIDQDEETEKILGVRKSWRA